MRVLNATRKAVFGLPAFKGRVNADAFIIADTRNLTPETH
jgi:hypothetical protein